MTPRASLARTALSVLIVGSTAMGSLLGALFLFVPAAAQTCDQPGPVIQGDWTITTPQVCTGILYTVDGNIAVNAGGSLTLTNGGLKFTEDTTAAHQYSLTVNPNGVLILDNSIVTTEPRSIDAYVKLTLSVAGANARFTMQNGAVLKFPGAFNSGAGATISIRSSTITGFDRSEVEPWVGGAWDDNDDSPTITWASTTATVFDSTITRLYENLAGVVQDPRMIMTLSGTTTLTAINSYIGVDFNSDTAKVHNEIHVGDGTRAFLVGVTIDQAGSGPSSSWIPAYVPVVGGSGTFYLYRWLDAFVTDSSGVPVNLATVWSQMSPFIQTAFYPDNALAFCPGPTILSYLNKACGTFNQTGADGSALIPLFTDQINTTTFPNAESFGNFEVTGRSAPFSATAGVSYDAYPIIDTASNRREVTLRLAGLTLPRPDLVATGATWTSAHGVTPLQGDDVVVSVTIRNQPPATGGAGTFLVRFLDGSNFLADRTAGPLGAGASTVVAVTIPSASGGNHSLRVIVDVNDVVPETNEGNNTATFTIPVTPIGPYLTVLVSFTPNPGFAENTVVVRATVVNNGGANASNFLVDFKQGTLASDPYATLTVGSVSAGNSTVVSIDWVPSTPGSYAWCAVVDPDQRIPEPAPYREDDNSACATLPVNPAPNLQVFSQDLRTSDPYPFQGDSVTLQATLRNTGQAGAPGSFVDFYMDDNLIQRVAVGALAVGSSSLVTTTNPWTAAPCGFHTIRAVVDPTNTVQEGSIYESDNSVTASVQVYPAGFVPWGFTATISGSVIPVAGSIEITGSVTIVNGGVYVSQQAEACNRGLIKIIGNGRLTLVNSTIASNWPLTVYLADNAQLITSAGSSLDLDGAQGPGTLRSDMNAQLTLTATTVDADVLASGAAATFKTTSFQGTTLYINTAGKSSIWDADLGTVTNLQLRSDDLNLGTPDFDIRNTTFNAVLTPQLHFGGRQWAQLTSVTTTLPPGTDWWTGMLSQSAKVTRYWWLRVDAVDGTGTLLEGANALFTVRRLDTTNLNFVTVGNPAANDIYMAATTTWPVSAPLGYIIYRASAEDRFVSPGSQWANATYRGDASATVNLIQYFPDRNLTAFVQADTTIRLVFSALTPEMSISGILPYYEANQTSVLPLNKNLNITAVVNNTGSISVRNVVVSFFSTNVDQNNDGVMDAPKVSYMGAGLWIGDYTVPLLPLRATRVAWVIWNPSGVAETTRPISVVVDAPLNNPQDPGQFRELDERNNTDVLSVLLHVWPDLNIGSADISPVGTAIDDNPMRVDVTVHNDGTNDATGASLVLVDDLGFPPARVPFTLLRGGTVKIPVTWTPSAPGNHTISVGVYTPPLPGQDPRVLDHNWPNNWASLVVPVKTKPDIWLNPADFSTPLTGTRGVPFDMDVTVRNQGDTDANGFAVSVFLDGDIAAGPIGSNDLVNVSANSFARITIRVTANAVSTHALTVFADSKRSDGTITTGSGKIVEGIETNNWANQTIVLVPPQGTITINPLAAIPFAPGTNLLVDGFVTQTGGGGGGLSGLLIVVTLETSGGAAVSATNTTSGVGGAWTVGLPIPGTVADGTYTIRASTPGATIPDATTTITVRNPTLFWNIVLLGLPVWIWLIIIIAAVVIVVGVTLYFRVYGLGKMVECGECGSFIPEDSTTCPKCGVEFEKDMAKCSNCQAWIPVDVKQCPECGVEFATGKVEMADYQEKMRMQYDEVVAKFREESQRTLGRALTEREFQDWWRKQPTFVTFEDWLREEEEMRKMGSKPCPACGTLNSVTATVCHKCGTYLKEEKRPPGGGAGPPRREAPPTEAAAEPTGGPSEAVPKKVIRKPVTTPPVVQKKVIKRPSGEQQQEGGGSGDTQNPPEEEF